MKEFEDQIRTHLKERGWDNLRPSDLAKSIMIEGAELLEIFQWDNQTAEEVRNNPEKMARIKKELADVLIYAFDMGVTLGIDMEEMVEAKLEKVKEKYPVEVFNPETRSSEAGTEHAYKAIKEQYRREGR